MRIYRVEHVHTGNGPFNSLAFTLSFLRANGDGARSNETHQTPMRDECNWGILFQIPDRVARCGVQRKTLIKHWFGWEGCLEMLRQMKMHVVVYSVPARYVARCSHQVVFNRARATVVSKHALEEFLSDKKRAMKITLVNVFGVWNPKGHQPRKMHKTYELAQAEAERLAARQPEDQFYVIHYVTRTTA